MSILNNREIHWHAAQPHKTKDPRPWPPTAGWRKEQCASRDKTKRGCSRADTLKNPSPFAVLQAQRRAQKRGKGEERAKLAKEKEKTSADQKGLRKRKGKCPSSNREMRGTSHVPSPSRQHPRSECVMQKVGDCPSAVQNQCPSRQTLTSHSVEDRLPITTGRFTSNIAPWPKMSQTNFAVESRRTFNL